MNELKDKIVAILEDMGATDVTVIDLQGKTVIADTFILATGRSTTNVRAIADAVEEKIEKEEGVAVLKREGRDEANWIVLDYDEIIVHVFSKETRQRYSLEMLWGEN